MRGACKPVQLGKKTAWAALTSSFFNNEKTRKDLAWTGAHNPIFFTTEHTEHTEILKVVALTDELACENLAMSRLFVEKRRRERKSRPMLLVRFDTEKSRVLMECVGLPTL